MSALTMRETDVEPGAVMRCGFVIEKKKRFCRMNALIGEKFCGEHIIRCATSLKTTEAKNRMVCPLDPTHTCSSARLQRHLRRCNARAPPPPAYHSTDVNVNAQWPTIAGDTHAPGIHEVSDERLMSLLDHIDRLYDERAEPLVDMRLSHAVLSASLADPQLGADSKKHLHQNAAILGILERLGVLDTRFTYVELGSGKAHLSYWLSRAITATSSSSSSSTSSPECVVHVVLVDRASHRHKAENRLKDSTQTVHARRLKMDIRHLWLPGCDDCSHRPLVGYGKHLCGAASDMGLRALTASPTCARFVADKDRTANLLDLRAVVLALCCHHRLDFASYVGLEFLLDECRLSVADLNCLKGVAAWATCGTPGWHSDSSDDDRGRTNPSDGSTDASSGLTDASSGLSDTSSGLTDASRGMTDASSGLTHPANGDRVHRDRLRRNGAGIASEGGYGDNADTGVDTGCVAGTGDNRYRRLKLSPRRRTELGFKCKRLLDTGRVDYLRRRLCEHVVNGGGGGWQIQLARYVDSQVSPENIALVAVSKHS